MNNLGIIKIYGGKRRCFKNQELVQVQQLLYFIIKQVQENDREEVIDKDTETLINLEKKNTSLFISNIFDIKVLLLMSTSKSDEMLNNDLEKEFHEIEKKQSTYSI